MVQGKSTFYHPELDALRFVAFCLVFLAHSVYYVEIPWAQMPQALAVPLAALHDAGYYGVDLFFVLSAYLITELLLRERERSGTVDLGKFYIRRALRIWPLYFFFLLVARPLASLLLPREQHMSAGTLVSFLLFVGNWHCAFYGWPASISSALWSVSIEEQFYLAWPPLMKFARQHLVAAGVGMLAVANLTRVYMVHTQQPDPGIWCNTLTRLDPIAGGILLAAWLHGRENRLSAPVRVALALGAAGVMLLVGHFGDHTSWRALLVFPAVGGACTALVLATLRPMNTWVPGVVGRAFVYLGRISYGLYVYHLLSFELIRLLPPRPLLLTLALAMGLAILLATLSFYLLEMPFLRLKERFTVVRSRHTLLQESSRQTAG